ncbi:MAG TPA: TetR/AcrR family transcriptional regulator [Pseudonocardia sp.]|jgi:AcrR family transcriptional regulator|nr:TetR/AcrR family transcriptional regulator [Pseudonocardia sp.]
MTETVRSDASAGNVQRGARLSRDARRVQLLGAARDVFAAHGYHAAAMDDIADRAGVSKPVLYQHFPSKLELYQALLTTYVEELTGTLRGALVEITDNEQRVRAAISAYFDFVASDGESFRLVFESDLRGEPEAAELVNKALTDCVDLVTDAVTRDAGLDQNRARLLAVGLVGLSQVTARYWLDAGKSVPQEEAVELMSRLAWRGLAHFPMVHE